MVLFKIFNFIGDKNPNYTLNIVLEKYLRETPVIGEGYLDEKGKQGKWVQYYTNGSIFLETTYQNNKLHGKYVARFIDNTIFYVDIYEHGIRISHEYR